MTITMQVVKYPRAPALGRGLWKPKNRMVRRSKGGAIEPPMASTTSPGRKSLMNMLLAVVRAMWNRTRLCCVDRLHRRTGYHRFCIPLPTQAPGTLFWILHLRKTPCLLKLSPRYKAVRILRCGAVYKVTTPQRIPESTPACASTSSAM